MKVGRKNKIEKYNLMPEVISLKKLGKSNVEIATYIRQKYQDIPELANITPFVISRYLTQYFEQNTSKAKDIIDDELTESVYDKFKKKLVNLSAKIEERNLKLETLWNEAMEKKDIHQLSKISKMLNENEEEMRQDIVALLNYADKKLSPLIQYTEHKEIQINNILLNFSNVLCPVCKQKVLEVINSQSV